MTIFPVKYPNQQTDSTLSPKESLPTMYDLPSEEIGESGVPDEFHILQPQLLSLTFRPPHYPSELTFSATDLNLYYDVHHQNWYKRPDWFGVVGVSRLYEEQDLRLSYVIWQEEISPIVAVELSSPGTEKEDLGKTFAKSNQPPTKWQVYEQILRIPYYIIFNRYTEQLRLFVLTFGSYEELILNESKMWLPLLELAIGLWRGNYQGIERLWLRWYDSQGNLIPTPLEQEQLLLEQEKSLRKLVQQEKELVQQEKELAQQEKKLAQQEAEKERNRAEEAEKRAELLAKKMQELGIEI